VVFLAYVHLALFLALSLSPLFPDGVTMRSIRLSVPWRSCLGCSHCRPVRDVRTADSSADGRRSAAIFATVELPSAGGGATPYLLFSYLLTCMGGSVAEWLACWTQAQKGPGSNRSRDAVG